MSSTQPRIRGFDDPDYNPFLADEMSFGDQLDPYPALAELRSKGPIHKGDYRILMGLAADITMQHLEHYTVVGYEEVHKTLNDPATFSNAGYRFNLGISFGESISTMDPPDHARYRRIFQKAFLPNVVSTWGQTLVDPVVNALMDAFIARKQADLIQDFTLHYPFHIIYRQLALPPQDIAIFHKLAIAQTVVSFDREHGIEASEKLGEYFKTMVKERRRNPGDDLISLLAMAEVDGEKLPDNILISFLRQLINAGGDTTYRGTSILLTGLLRNPEQLEAVRNDRTLVPQAIEEALRWDGPVLMQTRMLAKDAILADVALKAGTILDVCAGAANRDPLRFPNPDSFNIFRERTHRHFAFASGPHVCIGQHLARVEMTRALNAIFDRLPNLRLDPGKPAPEIRGIMMRVPKHLYVCFD